MNYRKATFSGIIIGIGIIMANHVNDRYILSALFSIAILTVMHFELPLFTGLIGKFDGELKSAITLGKVMILNFVGVGVTVALSGLMTNEVFIKVANTRFDKAPLTLIIISAFCGVLMTVAIMSKNQLIAVFAIMTFILSGFEHCIVDFPYFLSALSIHNTISFALVVLGNSLGGIITYQLLKEKGNKHGKHL